MVTPLLSSRTASSAKRLAALCTAGLFLAFPATAGASGADDAKAMLKSMSDYVSAQQTLSSDFDVEIDIITPDVEKIRFSSSGHVEMARPDKIHFVREGGNIDVNLFFDGNTLTLVDKEGTSYSQIKTAGTVDSVLALLRRDYRIELPVTDVLLTNSYDTLVKGVLSAKDLGPEMVDGVECEHLFFRNAETDWQLWVRTGAQRLPCKYLIVSKTIAAGPEYSVRYRNWSSGKTAPANEFTFNPSGTAKLIAFDQMSANSGLLAATPSP